MISIFSLERWCKENNIDFVVNRYGLRAQFPDGMILRRSSNLEEFKKDLESYLKDGTSKLKPNINDSV